MKNLLTVWIGAGLMITGSWLSALGPEAMAEDEDYGFTVVDSDYEEDGPGDSTDSEGRSIPSAPSPDSMESETLSRSSGDLTATASPSSVSSRARTLSPLERAASVVRKAH